MLRSQRVKLRSDKLLNFVQTLANFIESLSVIKMSWCAPPYTTAAEINHSDKCHKRKDVGWKETWAHRVNPKYCPQGQERSTASIRIAARMIQVADREWGSDYRCYKHSPIVSSILYLTDTPRYEAHDNGDKTYGNTNNVYCQDGHLFAVVDVCQLVLGLIWRKTIVEDPVDGSLRSHEQCFKG